MDFSPYRTFFFSHKQCRIFLVEIRIQNTFEEPSVIIFIVFSLLTFFFNRNGFVSDYAIVFFFCKKTSRVSQILGLRHRMENVSDLRVKKSLFCEIRMCYKVSPRGWARVRGWKSVLCLPLTHIHTHTLLVGDIEEQYCVRTYSLKKKGVIVNLKRF